METTLKIISDWCNTLSQMYDVPLWFSVSLCICSYKYRLRVCVAVRCLRKWTRTAGFAMATNLGT